LIRDLRGYFIDFSMLIWVIYNISLAKNKGVG
jgi:hypothetical protein